MKKSVSRVVFTSVFAASLFLSGCLAKPAATEAAATDTATADPTLTNLVGVWETACAGTGNVNGSAAYMKRSLSILSDGTFSYLVVYYSGASCTGTMIWIHTPGALAVGSASTAPAGGHYLRFTHGSAAGINTSTAGGAAHLNSLCGWAGTFSSNGGLVPGGDWSCTGDSRFTLKGPGTVVDIAVVNNTTTIDTTAVTFNMPGVLSGVTVDSSTSLTFTKQ